VERQSVNLLILEPGERSLSPADSRARHILRVLKLVPGDTVRAGELGARLGTAMLTATEGGRVDLAFTAIDDPPPRANVELLLGHPRPIVLRRMLRDLSAIGPARIAVTVTDLGEKSYYRSNLWDDTATPLREGAAQGGSTLVPEVTRHWSLSQALNTVGAPAGRRLALHAQSSGVPHLLTVLAALAPGAPVPERSQSALALAVGSERGWSERELGLLAEHGFAWATLGQRILRTETAAAAAVWAAVSWYAGRDRHP